LSTAAPPARIAHVIEAGRVESRRVIFRFEDGDALEVDYVDYH
jgi:hypothetical protein